MRTVREDGEPRKAQIDALVIEKRSERVNRAVCRWSFFDLNRGGATVDPLRLPVFESSCALHAASKSRSACCSTPTGQSERNARSAVAFA